MLWFLISTVKQSCTTRRRTVCYIHPDIDHFCCSSFIPDVLSFLLISVFFCFKTFFFCNSIIACLLLTNPLSFLYLRIFIWFLFLKVNSTGCRILHYTSFHSTFQKYFCSFFWPHDFWWDIHSHVSHHSSKNIHHFSLGALQVFSFIFGHKQFIHLFVLEFHLQLAIVLFWRKILLDLKRGPNNILTKHFETTCASQLS